MIHPIDLEDIENIEEAAKRGQENQARLKELIGEEAATLIFNALDNVISLYLGLEFKYNNLHNSHHHLCDAFEQLHDLTCPNCLNKDEDDNKLEDVLSNDTIT